MIAQIALIDNSVTHEIIRLEVCHSLPNARMFRAFMVTVNAKLESRRAQERSKLESRGLKPCMGTLAGSERIFANLVASTCRGRFCFS
jgi:hypothetical protein